MAWPSFVCKRPYTYSGSRRWEDGEAPTEALITTSRNLSSPISKITGISKVVSWKWVFVFVFLISESKIRIKIKVFLLCLLCSEIFVCSSFLFHLSFFVVFYFLPFTYSLLNFSLIFLHFFHSPRSFSSPPLSPFSASSSSSFILTIRRRSWTTGPGLACEKAQKENCCQTQG